MRFDRDYIDRIARRELLRREQRDEALRTGRHPQALGINNLNGLGVGASAGDPWWDRVVLATHMDGANGSTSIVDLKGHPITCYGNAQLSTAQSKFGGASLLLDGTGDYIELADSADWHSGANNFCYDGWGMLTNGVGNPYPVLLSQRAASTYAPIQCYIDSTGASPKLSLAYSTTGTSWNQILNGTTGISLNTWFYWCYERVGGYILAELNGAIECTSSNIGTTALYDSAQPLRLGEGGGYYCAGYTDDARMTMFANATDYRYGGAHTPPAAAFLEG